MCFLSAPQRLQRAPAPPPRRFPARRNGAARSPGWASPPSPASLGLAGLSGLSGLAGRTIHGPSGARGTLARAPRPRPPWPLLAGLALQTAPPLTPLPAGPSPGPRQDVRGHPERRDDMPSLPVGTELPGISGASQAAGLLTARALWAPPAPRRSAGSPCRVTSGPGWVAGPPCVPRRPPRSGLGPHRSVAPSIHRGAPASSTVPAPSADASWSPLWGPQRLWGAGRPRPQLTGEDTGGVLPGGGAAAATAQLLSAALALAVDLGGQLGLCRPRPSPQGAT